MIQIINVADFKDVFFIFHVEDAKTAEEAVKDVIGSLPFKCLIIPKDSEVTMIVKPKE